MKRASRLDAAKHWIPKYIGKNIIKGYKNWFGLDVECAIKELKMLGVKLDDQRVSQILMSNTQRIASRQKKLEEKKQALDYSDSDDRFYFIAGYTSGGFPYGTTWEEAVLDFGEEILCF